MRNEKGFTLIIKKDTKNAGSSVQKKSWQSGFTLIEMMIVMLIISVLLIITIPNITKNNSNINNKGCSAFKKMVEAQIQSFEMEKDRAPESIDELITEGYLKTKSCPDGTPVVIQADGTVDTVIQ